jgi:hypothetical protein
METVFFTIISNNPNLKGVKLRILTGMLISLFAIWKSVNIPKCYQQVLFSERFVF